MTAQSSRTVNKGFSLLELLVTIAIIAVLAALLAPSLSKSFGKAKQIHCVSKLRQVGLGLHSFAQDHDGSFPWQIPTLKGGSMYETRFQLKASPLLSYSGRHFEVLSNELVTPKIVVCPADKQRETAETFTRLKTNNVSYWVFYRASLNYSIHPLAGDLNVQSVGTNRSRVAGRTNLLSIRFDEKLHQYKGNILFADGHVEGIKNADLPDEAPSSPSTGFGTLQTAENGPNGSITSPGKPPTNPLYPAENPNEINLGSSKPSPLGEGISSKRQLSATTPTHPTERSFKDTSPALSEEPLSAAAIQVGITSVGGFAPAAPPGSSAPFPSQSSASSPTPGRFGGVDGVKSTPEPDELSTFWPPNLKTLQDGIKFSFLLGLILTLLGLVWFYLNRRRKEAPRDKRQTSPSLPLDY